MCGREQSGGEHHRGGLLQIKRGIKRALKNTAFYFALPGSIIKMRCILMEQKGTRLVLCIWVIIDAALAWRREIVTPGTKSDDVDNVVKELAFLW